MARLTPAEIEALRAKTFGGSVPVAAPTPTVVAKPRLTPAEIEALRVNTFGGATAPVVVAPVGDEKRFESVRTGEVIKAAEAQGKAVQAGGALRQASILEERQASPETFDQAVARLNADALVKDAAPPIQVGNYNPSTYTPFGFAVTTRPQDIAVPKAEAGDFFTALAPQVRAGGVAAAQDARKVGQVFDDAAFYDSVKDLPEAERQQNLDAYGAFKAGFAKLRELNPVETGVTDDELIKDLQRQIKAAESGEVQKYTQDPAKELEASGSDVARALQPQVKAGTVPIYEPGALAFIETMKTKQLGDAKAKAIDTEVARLKAEGVPVYKTVNPPAAVKNAEPYEVQTGVRPATDADIATAREMVSRRIDTEMALPFYMRSDRDKILKDLEANATGGTLFEKQYPTGATVESAMSHGLRAIFSVPNYVAGELMETVTPEGITEKERLSRPPLYKDSSAGVYNVAESRGFMGEIQDMYRYHPDPWVRENEWIGTAGGFAADMLSFEAAGGGALLSGGRSGLETVRAGMAADRAVGTVLKESLASGSKTAGVEFMKNIGLPSAIKGVSLGDARLVSAAVVADNLRATGAYERVIAEGGTHSDALAKAKAAAPTSRAVEVMEKQGAAFDPATYIAKAGPEYVEYQKVATAADDFAAGKTAAEVDQLALRPHIAAAAKADTGVTTYLKTQAALADFARGAGEKAATKLKLSDILANVSDPVKFAQAVKDSAAFEAGFKSIDRAVGSTRPSKAVIAVTPRTYATEKEAEKIVEALRASDLGTVTAQIVPPAPPAAMIRGAERGRAVPITYRLNGVGRTGNGFALDAAQHSTLFDIVQREATTGTLPELARARIAAELDSGVISTQSLRELSYSVADGIAETIRRGDTPASFPARALSEAGQKAYTGETNILLNQARKLGRFIASKGTSEDARLAALLDPNQLEAIADAKRRMGEIDKVLKQEFDALADPDVARAYGLAPDATPTEKMAALLLGRKPDAFARESALYNYVRSSIHGTDNLSPTRFITGNWAYDGVEDIFNAEGRAKVSEIVSRYAQLAGDPRNTAALLPQMMDEIHALKDVKIIRPDGTVSDVPALLSKKYRGPVAQIFKSTKQDESLLGAYARTKGDEVFAAAMEKALANDPLTLGWTSDILAEKIGPVYSRIISAGTAHQLSGGMPLTNINELLALPRVKALAPAGSDAERLLRQVGPDVIEDVNATAMVTARKFGNGIPAEQYASELADLASGEIALSHLSGKDKNPFSIRRAVLNELGSSPKIGELQAELGKLAEEAAGGSLSAAKASRHAQALFDTMNSVFYNTILSFNPRFHTRNIVSAPFIVHMTTGMGLDPTDVMDAARILDIHPVGDMARLAREEGGAFKSTSRPNDIVVRDRLGNAYTAEDLYDAAVRSGALRSQMQATIDPRFLDEAAKLGVGSRLGAKFPKIKTAYGYPSHMANMEDNLWRLASISHAIKSGSTLDEALVLGRRSLFDFGTTTAAERKYVAGRIMFYNYFRNSVLQGAQSLLENPSRALRQYRLATDVSKISVGDKDWHDLTFYSPTDNTVAAGIAATVIDQRKKAGRESSLTVLPSMPFYDAAYLTTALLYQPIDLLAGPANPATGERNFGDGYVIGKLTPMTRTGVNLLVGQAVDADVKMAKNRLSPEHVAVADKFGLLPTLTEFYGAKARPAEPGEKAYKGVVYTLTEDQFNTYKKAVKFGLANTGGGRFVSDWSKVLAGDDISGPTQRGLLENIGVTSTYGQESPEVKQEQAATLTADRLKALADEKNKRIGITRDTPKKR